MTRVLGLSESKRRAKTKYRVEHLTLKRSGQTEENGKGHSYYPIRLELRDIVSTKIVETVRNYKHMHDFQFTLSSS